MGQIDKDVPECPQGHGPMTKAEPPETDNDFAGYGLPGYERGQLGILRMSRSVFLVQLFACKECNRIELRDFHHE